MRTEYLSKLPWNCCKITNTSFSNLYCQAEGKAIFKLSVSSISNRNYIESSVSISIVGRIINRIIMYCSRHPSSHWLKAYN